MSDYSNQLKSPKWQRKRLEIFSRDNFTCVECGDDKNTLHVHHQEYKNCEIWDYPNESLITLCESCHNKKHPTVKDRLINLLKDIDIYSRMIDVGIK